MKLGHGSHRRVPATAWVLTALLVLPGAAASSAQLPDLKTAKRDHDNAQLQREWNRGERSVKVDKNVRPASHATPLGIAQLAPDQRDTGPMLVKVYAVADLLQKLQRDEAWPDDIPRDQLRQALVGHLKCFTTAPPAPLTVLTAVGGEQTQRPHVRFAWNGDRLLVSGSQAAHDLVATEIELRRQFSFRQVTVEVRLLQGSPDWCLPTEDNASAEGSSAAAQLRNRWYLFQQEFPNAEPTAMLPLAAHTAGQDLLVESANHPTVSVTAGTSSPVVYQFVDDNQFRPFMRLFKGDGLVNTILLAPKVTLYDGQQAEISDVSQRPFVTDVNKLDGDEGEAFQPVIQVFWEGTRIQLAPVITDDGHRMDCRFMFASIDDCKTFRSPRFPDALDLRIQHPVVSTNSFECIMDIPVGQTLLIGGLFPNDVEREADQSTLGRLLGRQPDKVKVEQVTYIAITPRTIEPAPFKR